MPTISYAPPVRDKFYCIRTSPAGTPSFVYNQNKISTYGPVCTRTTNSNPHWRIQIAKMQEAGRAYSVSRTTEKLTPSTSISDCFRGVNKGYTEDSYHLGVFPSFPSTLVTTDSDLRDLALLRLKRKLKKHVGGADALVPTAEARELKALVQTATKFSTKLIDTLIHIKRTKGKAAFKYASDAWLAYGFGIRPLVEDTKAIALAIEDYFNRSGNSGIRSSGSAKKTWMSHQARRIVFGSPLCWGPILWGTMSMHHTLSYRWYCGGTAETLCGADYSLAKHLNFSGKSLIPTAWELVPYSWVVDYFTNVGSFLEDTFQVLPGTMYYSGYTRRYELKTVAQYEWVIPRDWTASIKNGRAETTRFEFSRTPSGANLPYIGLRFKSYDEVGFMGVTKLLNLAAVLIQRKI